MYEIIIILVLILLNGIFSMSEIALISARKSRLAKEEKQGKKSAKVALNLAAEPDRFLSTIQIGITTIGILTGIYSGDVLAKNFAVILEQWGVSNKYADELSQVLLVVVITYLTLVLGELLPKRIGMAAAEKVATMVAVPMNFLSKLGAPFVWILSISTSGLIKLLRLSSSENKVTEEEIKMFVKEGAKEGEIQEVEQDIVERVFLLGDLKVKNIMTHRSDLTYMDISMTRAQVREVLAKELYELYPVVAGSLDNVKGAVKLKDLVLYIDSDEFNLNDVVHPVEYFFENMTVYKVLEQMRVKHISQALIVNEFGTCEGIITLKDILEGLVGEMSDSHEEPDIIICSDGNHWMLDGQCSFHDFLSYFELEDFIQDNHYDTIAGLILDKTDHIPSAGEEVSWNGFIFKIESMDRVRINRVLVTRGYITEQ